MKSALRLLSALFLVTTLSLPGFAFAQNDVPTSDIPTTDISSESGDIPTETESVEGVEVNLETPTDSDSIDTTEVPATEEVGGEDTDSSESDDQTPSSTVTEEAEVPSSTIAPEVTTEATATEGEGTDSETPAVGTEVPATEIESESPTVETGTPSADDTMPPMSAARIIAPADATCANTTPTGKVTVLTANSVVWLSSGATHSEFEYSQDYDEFVVDFTVPADAVAGDVLAFNVFGLNHLPPASGGIIYDSTTGLELGCVTVTSSGPKRASVMLTGLVDDRPGITATLNVAVWKTGRTPNATETSAIGRIQLTYTFTSAEPLPRVTDSSEMAVEPWDVSPDKTQINWRIVVGNGSDTDALPAQTVTITQDATHTFDCSQMTPGTVLIKFPEATIDSYNRDPSAVGTVLSCSATEVVVAVDAVAPGNYTSFELVTTVTQPDTEPHTIAAVSSNGNSISGTFDHFPDDRDGSAVQANAVVLSTAPTGTAAVCADGVSVPGSGVTFEAPANTSVVIGEYDAASTETQNISVEVTTDAGYYFDENDPAFNAAVWTVTPNEDGTETATASVELTNAPCASVIPVAITITPTVCTDGTTVAGTATYPTTEGVNYTSNYDPAAEGAQTVTVTATLTDGYTWGDLTDTGYTGTSAMVATYQVQVTNTACAAVTPEPTATTTPEPTGTTTPEPTGTTTPEPTGTTTPEPTGTATPGAPSTPVATETGESTDPDGTQAPAKDVTALPNTGSGVDEGISGLLLTASSVALVSLLGAWRSRRD